MVTAAPKLQSLPDVIEPRWALSDGVLPLDHYVIDGAEYAMDDEDLAPAVPVRVRDAHVDPFVPGRVAKRHPPIGIAPAGQALRAAPRRVQTYHPRKSGKKNAG